jgi:hypothetical protein
MRKYFGINGFWKDDKSTIDGSIVTNYDDVEVDGKFDEDDIFYFGLEESNLQHSLDTKGDDGLEFVVTSFTEILIMK